MTEQKDQLIRELTQELQSIAGWGVTERKAATSLPQLRQTFSIPGDIAAHDAKHRLEQCLRKQIHLLTGDLEILDTPVVVSAKDLRPALECLFQLVDKSKELRGAPYAQIEEAHNKRREYVIRKLGLGISPRTFRLPGGKETQLMRFLAQRFVDPPGRNDGIRHEQVQLLMSLDERGAPQQATVIEKARFTRDGVDRASFEVGYAEDDLAWRDFEVEAIEGLISIQKTLHARNQVAKIIPLFRPQRLGDELTYMFSVHFSGARPMKSNFYHIRYAPYERASVEVRFSPKRRPSTVWSFAGVPTHDVADLTEGPTCSSSDGGLTYRSDFSDCATGLAYGLGWEWRG